MMESLKHLTSRHLELLEFERIEEEAQYTAFLTSLTVQELEENGAALTRLEIDRIRPGLGDKLLVRFCRRSHVSATAPEQQKKQKQCEEQESLQSNKPVAAAATAGARRGAAVMPCVLPWHRFKNGSIVNVYDRDAGPYLTRPSVDEPQVQPHQQQEQHEKPQQQHGGVEGTEQEQVNKCICPPLACGVMYRVSRLFLLVAFGHKNEQSGDSGNQPTPYRSISSVDEAQKALTLGNTYTIVVGHCSHPIEEQMRALRRLQVYPQNGPARRIIDFCFSAQTQTGEMEQQHQQQQQNHLPTPTDSSQQQVETQTRSSAAPDNLTALAEVEKVEGTATEVRTVAADDIGQGQREAAAAAAAGAAGKTTSENTARDTSSDEIRWINQNLVPAQRQAVLLGLNSRDVALIHGPPGTGKTSTVVELLLQLVLRGNKVLACAPSNVAVDNMLAKLRKAVAAALQPTAPRSYAAAAAAQDDSSRSSDTTTAGADADETGGEGASRADVSGEARYIGSSSRTKAAANKRKEENEILRHLQREGCVRVGHPARVDPALFMCRLDYRQREERDKLLSWGARERLRELQRKLKKAIEKGARGSAGGDTSAERHTRMDLRAEIWRLTELLRACEQQALVKVLDNADIFFTTCISSYTKAIQEYCERRQSRPPFNVAIIDEAAQALEAECWVTLLLAERAVLAGDHKQLGPVVKSAEAERGGLKYTLFERLMASYKPQTNRCFSQLLNTQFRMHETIMKWSSKHFYEDKLQAHHSVARRLLAQPRTQRSATREATARRSTEKREDTEATTWTEEAAEKAEIGGGGGTTGGAAGAAAQEDAEVRVLPPWLWIDTAGVEWTREDIEGDLMPGKATAGVRAACSRSNLGEAGVVLKYVRMLLQEWNLQPEDVAIITPYTRQVQLLQQLFQKEDDDQQKTHGGAAAAQVHVCGDNEDIRWTGMGVETTDDEFEIPAAGGPAAADDTAGREQSSSAEVNEAAAEKETAGATAGDAALRGETAPAEVDEAAAEKETAGATAGDAALRGETAPAEVGDAAAEKETAGATAGDAALRGETAPAEVDEAAAEKETAGATAGDAALRGETAPAEVGDAAAEKETAGATAGDAAQRGETAPAEVDEAAAEKETAGATAGDAALRGETAPAEVGDAAAEKETAGATAGDAAQRGETAPAEVGDAAAEKETAGATAGDAALRGDTAPAEVDEAAAEKETAGATAGDAALRGETAPAEVDEAAAEKETAGATAGDATLGRETAAEDTGGGTAGEKHTATAAAVTAGANVGAAAAGKEQHAAQAAATAEGGGGGGAATRSGENLGVAEAAVAGTPNEASKAVHSGRKAHKKSMGKHARRSAPDGGQQQNCGCAAPLLSAVAVNTVDGFQGKECEVIILSLVRSNLRRLVGFLEDPRRLNVAVTRAKRHLVIIGDSETIAAPTTCLTSAMKAVSASREAFGPASVTSVGAEAAVAENLPAAAEALGRNSSDSCCETRDTAAVCVTAEEATTSTDAATAPAAAAVATAGNCFAAASEEEQQQEQKDDANSKADDDEAMALTTTAQLGRAVLQSLFEYALTEGEVRCVLEYADVDDRPALPAGFGISLRAAGGATATDRTTMPNQQQQEKKKTQRPSDKKKKAAARRKTTPDEGQGTSKPTEAATSSSNKKAEATNTASASDASSPSSTLQKQQHGAAPPMTCSTVQHRVTSLLWELRSQPNHQQFPRQHEAASLAEPLQVSEPYTALGFPATLSAYERKVVYQTAERMGLRHHVEIRKGGERRVVVSLPVHERLTATQHGGWQQEQQHQQQQEKQAPQPQHQQQTVGDRKRASKKTVQATGSSPGNVREQSAGKLSSGEDVGCHVQEEDSVCRVPAKIKDEATGEEEDEGENDTVKQSPADGGTSASGSVDSAADSEGSLSGYTKGVAACRKAAVKKKRRATTAGKAGADAAEEDLDALIKAAVAADGRCSYGRKAGKVGKESSKKEGTSKSATEATRPCKNPAHLLGWTCPFCKQRFCLTHAIPEVHGCGDAASAHARTQFNQIYKNVQAAVEQPSNTGSGRATSSSGAAVRNSSWFRRNMQQRLWAKIEEAKKKRTVQPKKPK